LTDYSEKDILNKSSQGAKASETKLIAREFCCNEVLQQNNK